MAQRELTQDQLRSEFPAAFEALPECYQADSCLQFFIDCNGNLCAEPKPDQVFALGQFESVFAEGRWVTG